MCRNWKNPMKKLLVKEVLDVLVMVQKELSKHAESNVSLEVNRIIEELAKELDKDTIDADVVLTSIGKVLNHIPAVIRLIELLSD